MTEKNKWNDLSMKPNDKETVLVAWYSKIQRKWEIRVSSVMNNGRFFGFDSPYQIEYEPTHWTSLPEPPEEDL